MRLTFHLLLYQLVYYNNSILCIFHCFCNFFSSADSIPAELQKLCGNTNPRFTTHSARSILSIVPRVAICECTAFMGSNEGSNVILRQQYWHRGTDAICIIALIIIRKYQIINTKVTYIAHIRELKLPFS